jgi:hypothetical protein
LNDLKSYLFSFNNEGGLGIIWSVVWLIFASDTPATNTHISDKEKEYIRACKAEEKIQDTRTVRKENLSYIFFYIFVFRKHHGEQCYDHKGFGVYFYQCSFVILVSMVCLDFLYELI